YGSALSMPGEAPGVPCSWYLSFVTTHASRKKRPRRPRGRSRLQRSDGLYTGRHAAAYAKPGALLHSADANSLQTNSGHLPLSRAPLSETPRSTGGGDQAHSAREPPSPG